MYFLIEFLSAFRSLFKAAHLKLCGLLITYVCITYQEEVFVNFTPLKCTTHIKTQVLKNVQIADRWRKYAIL